MASKAPARYRAVMRHRSNEDERELMLAERAAGVSDVSRGANRESAARKLGAYACDWASGRFDSEDSLIFHPELSLPGTTGSSVGVESYEITGNTRRKV